MIRILLFYGLLLQNFDLLSSSWQSNIRPDFTEHRDNLKTRREGVKKALQEFPSFKFVLPPAHEVHQFLERRFWFVEQEKLHIMADVLAQKQVNYKALSAYFMVEMYDFFEVQDKDKFFTVCTFAKELILNHAIFPEGFDKKYRYR